MLGYRFYKLVENSSPNVDRTNAESHARSSKYVDLNRVTMEPQCSYYLYIVSENIAYPCPMILFSDYEPRNKQVAMVSDLKQHSNFFGNS